MLEKALLGARAALALGAAFAGAFGWYCARAYDASLARVYDVPVPRVERSTDPAVLARGRHLAESLGNCTGCHGNGLSGGRSPGAPSELPTPSTSRPTKRGWGAGRPPTSRS